jgi:polyhydroxyalkanoate synthesis regulator phasin
MGEVTTKEKKEILRNFVHSTYELAHGFSDWDEAKRKRLVNDLVESGKMTLSEGEELLAQLSIKIAESEKLLFGSIDTCVAKTIDKIEAVSEKVLNDLEARIDRLESRCNQSRKPHNGGNQPV